MKNKSEEVSVTRKQSIKKVAKKTLKKQDVSEIAPVVAESVKNKKSEFLWSAFFGGVLISWFVHRKAFKNDNGYFWPVFGISIVCKLSAEVVAASIQLPIMTFITYIIAYAGISYYARMRIDISAPDYDAEIFEKNERLGIILGLVVFAINCISMLV